jgi:hypothetical protein
MRRLVRLLAGALVAAWGVSSGAQTFVIPQTVQQTLATNTACTGGVQNFNVQNLGQTQHYAFITWSTQPSNALAVFQGIDNTGNVSIFSDAMQGQVSTTGTTSAIAALGYFPVVRIQVVCTGANFTIAYSGTSATGFIPQGAALATQVDKNLLVAVAANLTQASQPATPPFGNSAGEVIFQYSVTGPAGSTLVVNCGGSSPSTNFGSGTVQNYTFTLQTAAVQQIFPVPASPCPFYKVTYNSGGASAATFNLEYLFTFPATSTDPCISGAKQTPAVINTTASAQIITGTAGTNVYVCSILLVVGAADNVALVEGTGATCGTGTAGMSGGATAATGWNLSANENLPMTGPNTIAQTVTRGDNVCLLVSSAAQVSGTITYAKL